jgi:hypothetical protein
MPTATLPALRPFCVLLAAAALLLPSACNRPAGTPATAPLPFTGQLPEVGGVQAIVSLRHPKLVNQDLGKFMAGVPETAMLRLVLSQFAAYGYPEFSEIAADSNVGLAVLSISAADLKAKSAVTIGLAKLKEGGKLWTLLQASHLAVQKQGDWVLIGKDEASLAKLKSPAAVISYLEEPQAEDLRLWGRASPDLLAALKDQFLLGVNVQLSALAPAQQKAALAYIDVLFSLLAQLHSAGLTLTFTDDAMRLTEFAQFLPDSPAGTYLRYQPGPPPAVAQLVSGDALLTGVFRQDPKAAGDLASATLDPFIAVGYPPVSDPLKRMKASYLALVAASDGGGAGVVDVTGEVKDGAPKMTPRFFYTLSGQFTPQIVRSYVQSGKALTDMLTNFMGANFAAKAGAPPGTLPTQLTENALTVDGATFDSWVIPNGLGGPEAGRTTDYVGAAGGNLVVADSEATLQQRLPALLAKTALADGIAVPASADEIGRMSLNGAKLVDLAAAAAKLDRSDPDIKAALDGFTADYAAGGPVTSVVTGGQAKGQVELAVPYKFIEASMHLGQYLSARKFNLLQLFTPGPPRSAAHPRRPSPAATP